MRRQEEMAFRPGATNGLISKVSQEARALDTRTVRRR